MNRILYTGIAVIFGGVTGIAAFVLGMVGLRLAAERIAVVAKEIQATGGPPNPRQLAELESLQERMRKSGFGEPC